MRPFAWEDAAHLFGWFPDEAAVVAWAGPSTQYPLDQRQLAGMLADPNRTIWTPTLAGEVAGHFQLFYDRRRRTMRLGRFTIAPGLRGRGLATPLVRLAAGLAFAEPDVQRMELQVYEHNLPARAAYTRAGFTLDGILREDLPVVSGGETRVWSTGVMSLLRSEWRG